MTLSDYKIILNDLGLNYEQHNSFDVLYQKKCIIKIAFNYTLNLSLVVFHYIISKSSYQKLDVFNYDTYSLENLNEKQAKEITVTAIQKYKQLQQQISLLKINEDFKNT